MTIEFIIVWLICGVIIDVLFIFWRSRVHIKRQQRNYERFCERNNYTGANLNTNNYYSFTTMYKEAPWWSHLLLILLPPSVLLAIELFSEAQ